MTTVDAFGALHDARGKFAGHVAHESALSLEAPVSRRPTSDGPQRVASLRAEYQRARSAHLAASDWMDSVDVAHTAHTIANQHPDVVSVQGYATDRHSDDGSFYVQLDTGLEADGTHVRLTGYPSLPQGWIEQGETSESDDMRWEGADITYPMADLLEAADYRAYDVGDRVERHLRNLDAEAPHLRSRAENPQNWSQQVEVIADRMCASTTHAVHPRMVADSTDDGLMLGCEVAGPDGKPMTLSRFVDFEDCSDDVSATGESQARATVAALDRHYADMLESARKLGLNRYNNDGETR